MTVELAIWIGGSTCSGKSTIADRIASRQNLSVYHVDERWARSPVDELVADTLAMSEERLPMILDDVATIGGDTIVEGFQVYPWLVAPLLGSPRQAVWLVCTPTFRREKHFGRAHAWALPSQTDDPERAQANRLVRDDRIGEHIAQAARERDLKTIVVDGTRSLEEVAAEVQAHLELAS